MTATSDPCAPVTLAIPTLNEGHTIRDMLKSVFNGTTRPAQILVIDGGSTDDTTTIAEDVLRAEYANYAILNNPRRRVPYALNIALDKADQPYFMRLDGHCTVNACYLETLYGHLASGDYGGAGGIKLARGISPQGRANAAAQNSPLGVGNSHYHYRLRLGPAEHIPFGFYRADLLRELQGWDERLEVNQDYELDYRIRSSGYELVIDPAAKIHWNTRESARGLYKQYRRYGRGKGRVIKAQPRSTRPRHLVPSAMLASAASVALFAPTAMAGFAASATLAAYAAGGLKTAATTRSPRVAASRATISLASMHAGYGIGVIEGLAGRSHLRSQLIGGSDAS